MRFRFSEEQERFKNDVRNFLAQEREKIKQLPREEFPETFYSDMGQTGWFGVAFPKEYGGTGHSRMWEGILLDELNVGAPEPVWTAALILGIAAPMILNHGSEEDKKKWLPLMAQGKIRVSVGCTEPDSGSDVANVQTRAIEDGDDFIVNGTKLYNDSYKYQYMITSVRTDTAGPKEKGISILMIDLNSPGITVSAMSTMWGFRRNEVAMEDVRVPKKNLIGERDEGYDAAFHTARNAEWPHMGSPTEIKGSFNTILDYVKQATHRGKPISEIPSIRHLLAELALELELAELIYYRALWLEEKGLPSAGGGAMTKLYTALLHYRIHNAMIDVTGQFGQLARARTGEARRLAPMRGLSPIMFQYGVSQTIAGWSADMQRNRIAAGLGLPDAE
ncbi:acyl-CoA dehydrogenase family protein [Chloroflexota bacterium]